MNSKSCGADMVYAWSNAEIGMMDAKSAAKIMQKELMPLRSTKKQLSMLLCRTTLCLQQEEDMWIQLSMQLIPKKICYRSIRDVIHKERESSGQKTRHGLSEVDEMKKTWKKLSGSYPHTDLYAYAFCCSCNCCHSY